MRENGGSNEREKRSIRKKRERKREKGKRTIKERMERVQEREWKEKKKW